MARHGDKDTMLAVHVTYLLQPRLSAMRWQLRQPMKKCNNGLGEAISLFSFPSNSLIMDLNLLSQFALPLEFFRFVFVLSSAYMVRTLMLRDNFDVILNVRASRSSAQKSCNKSTD